MANTKSLDRAKRKKAKRKSRHRLKTLYATMTRIEREGWKQEQESTPGLGFKKFLSDSRKKKE